VKKPNTVDFETMPIEYRPDYPPEPVGVAILEVGRKAKYWAWGHSTENNCSKAEAVRELKRLYADRHKRPLLFHNAKFDLDVASIHLGLAIPGYEEFDDTEFLMFLNDPHEAKLSLKPLADKHLGLPADEQTELHDWILSHVFTSEKTAQGSVVVTSDGKPPGFYKVPPSKAGKYIAYAPGKLVGKYAVGDVVRTRGLYDKFAPVVQERGMWPAYEREKRCMPILLENENHGVRINHNRLRRDLKEWEQSLDTVDHYLRRRLKAPDLEVMSGNALADALEEAGFVSEWVLTDKGNRSTSKDNLMAVIEDKAILQALTYRAKMAVTIQTFGRPWLAVADRTGGYIHTSWHQVRKADERGSKANGARTGRIQSTPNFQNVTNKPGESTLPRGLKGKVSELPYLRELVVPWETRHWLYGRDYSQQELRVLAHFEDGALFYAYQKDPNLNVHRMAQALVSELLKYEVAYKPIKILGFGIIYGMGLALLAQMMDVDYHTAKTLKEAYLAIFPDLKELDNNLKEIGRSGEYITTWGGRQYYVEPPTYFEGRRKTYEYKLLNYLVQGSSADCSKQAMINYHSIKDTEAKILLTVHDEFQCSAPKTLVKTEMKKLREAMADVDFDVPMLSDGKTGGQNWGSMKPFRD